MIPPPFRVTYTGRYPVKIFIKASGEREPKFFQQFVFFKSRVTIQVKIVSKIGRHLRATKLR